MSHPGWIATHLDEVTTLSLGRPEVPQWKPLRHALGIGAFGTNAWHGAQPGDPVVERHDELAQADDSAGHEELYVVLAGAAEFTVDGETFSARAGSLVFISDPRLIREAVATEPATTVLAIGAQRGAAFEPSTWEHRWLSAASSS